MLDAMIQNLRFSWCMCSETVVIGLKDGLQPNSGQSNTERFILPTPSPRSFSFRLSHSWSPTTSCLWSLFLSHTCKYFCGMTRQNDKSSQIKATLLSPLFPFCLCLWCLLPLSWAHVLLPLPCLPPHAWLEQVPFPPPLAEVGSFSSLGHVCVYRKGTITSPLPLVSTPSPPLSFIALLLQMAIVIMCSKCHNW